MDWFEIKNWLELSTGLDRDSLHIYAGIGVQLAVAFCFRRSLGSPIPWLFVAVAVLANEYYDYVIFSDSLEATPEYYDGVVRDIWNTLLLPSLFLVISRFWPTWLTGKAGKDSEPRKPEGDGPVI
ncbi:MAG: hypothetical protein ACI9TB_002713 [Parasphingorhabdus sp.]|mgnify:FL=1|jgi:hypothetical protein|uniref:hypothetical protein n=1 Tax=Parasphingorhabdus sp. TaxID=2709688 RepID=UPI002B275090|nr:hypothetical protein [Parasphingorhabdus sp.]|tara:strand:- start:891 stop:1265 length:375 start_codon:yes stop_codon:yes gene_type:complete